MIEQHAGAVGACPAQSAQPAAKAELDAALRELAVAVAGADFGRVTPALFALAVGKHTGRIGYAELDCEGAQNRIGHRRRVFQERAQKTHGRQLKRIAQAAAVAPFARDPPAVIVVKVEVTRQFVGAERFWIAAIAFPLRGGQEADRHGIKALRRRRWPE